MMRSIAFVFAILIALIGFIPGTLAASDLLGVKDNHLSSCPSNPNCVLSQNADKEHQIAPLVYQTDLDTARETLLEVLKVVPRTEVVEQTNNYIHARSKSRIFKFIDDVEFYFPSGEKIIHVRSAARVGESDLGVNRRRIEQIRLALKDLKV